MKLLKAARSSSGDGIFLILRIISTDLIILLRDCLTSFESFRPDLRKMEASSTGLAIGRSYGISEHERKSRCFSFGAEVFQTRIIRFLVVIGSLCLTSGLQRKKNGSALVALTSFSACRNALNG